MTMPDIVSRMSISCKLLMLRDDGFFVVGKRIIVTNAFRKKSDKLPKSEKEKAISNKAMYEKRG